jgi:enoyl-CoA hydratase
MRDLFWSAFDKMEFPQFSQISLSLKDRILLITINRPPHNYLSGRFFIELDQCREIILSEDVAAVVLTGNGKIFSKGFDIQEIRPVVSPFNQEMVIFANSAYSFLSNLNKPVVAAINGVCFGGGLELALASHIRLCAERSILGLPEVSVGLVPGLGGVYRLMRLVGETRAIEMLLLGDLISAQRAYEYNLVNRVMPRNDFLQQAMTFTRALIATHYPAVQHVLELIKLSRPESENLQIAESARRFAQLIFESRQKS